MASQNLLLKALADGIAFAQKFRVPTNDCNSLSVVFVFRNITCSKFSKTIIFSFGNRFHFICIDYNTQKCKPSVFSSASGMQNSSHVFLKEDINKSQISNVLPANIKSSN